MMATKLTNKEMLPAGGTAKVSKIDMRLIHNRDYWRDRAAQLEAMTFEGSVQTEAELVKLYKECYGRLEEQLAVWYAKFAEENEISYQAAKEILSTEELAAFRLDVKEYIRLGKLKDPELQKFLKQASAKFHVSRLEYLQVQTRMIIEQVEDQKTALITEAQDKAYVDRFYHTAFGIQKFQGVGYNLEKVDRHQLDLLRKKPWAPDKYNFSERIWKNKQKLIDALNKELTLGCIQGRNLDKMAKSISKVMDTTRYNAMRLCRTETAHFASLATQDTYKKCHVDEYEILVTHDDRLSDICAAMDGERFRVSEYSEGLTAPPFHVNCRSTTIPVVDDDEPEALPNGYQLPNGAQLPGAFELPEDMGFDQWLQKVR